jgi:hypothetical protein
MLYTKDLKENDTCGITVAKLYLTLHDKYFIDLFNYTLC